jgi:hypothetical protein
MIILHLNKRVYFFKAQEAWSWTELERQHSVLALLEVMKVYFINFAKIMGIAPAFFQPTKM